MKFPSQVSLALLFSLVAIPATNAADIVVSADTVGDVPCCTPLVAATENNQAIIVNNGITVGNTGLWGIALGTYDTGFTGTTITNNGTIYSNYGIVNSGPQTAVINAATGTIHAYEIGIYALGNTSSVVNQGTIAIDSGLGVGTGIAAASDITTVDNSGVIDVSTGNGIWNVTAKTIGTLNNTGTITVGGYGSGIVNEGTIVTLNNSQGAGSSAGALTFSGNLPTNYNVIVNSLTNYGKLTLNGVGGSGTTNFGIYSTSTLTAGTYTAVLSGLTTSNLSAARSGTYGGFSWTLALASGSLDIWDLIVARAGPNAANTLTTVQQSASNLSGVYNVQAAALQAGLTYDCNTFDKHGLCASVGGRATYGLTAPSGNQQAGLVVVSHKPDNHFRYGGFADQSVATASPNGIKYNNSGPMFGFFGYWNQQKDNMGWGASVTTAFSNSNLTVTRNASLADTEAGSGNTEMQGQAVQAQATYAMQATTRIKAQPYLGLRYYRVATGGYSEGSNADVTSPLTYNAMAQEVFAAVGGVGTSVFLAEKLTGRASVGIQQNLNYKMGNYQGTSAISGLESFSVNMPTNVNSMATATAGVTYAIKKNEKLSLNALWQQQAFMATNTMTALATYTIGF